MNIEISVIISVVAGILSVGTAYGMVKTKIKILEEKVDALGNTDNIVRKYLFSDDGMTIYAPVAQCDKSHTKLDKKLDSMEEKIDILINRSKDSL